MKKFVVLPVLLAVTFSACKKSASSASGSGSIKATINGTTETFGTSASATLISSYGTYSLAILGLTTASASADDIQITILGTSPIKAGTTYSSATTSGDEVQITYIKQATSTAYQTNPATSAGPSIITITSISSTNVQGTFSGPLMLESGTGASTVNVTNGSFNLSIR